MSKGSTFLAVTLALATGVGGGMLAGVKTAQNKESEIQAEAVSEAEGKGHEEGYEEGYQAGIVVNQGYSQEELDEAVADAEAAKQTIIDGLNEDKQTLTQQNTTLTEQKAALETQNETLTQEKTELTEQNNQLTEQNTNLTQQNETLTGQNTSLTQQNTQLTEQNTALENQNTALTEQNQTLTEQKAALEEQIAAGATVEVITPGLYDPGTGEMTMSWSDLIEQGIISLDENGVCKVNVDIPASGNYRPEQIDGAMDKLQMIQGKLVLSNDVRTIYRYGFAYASGLTEVVIPEGVVEIQTNAFRQCSLEKVTLPETLTTLGSQAFGYNYMLQEINIPSGITAIPSSLFSAGYHNMEDIFIIPDTVTSIGKKAFFQCDGIVFVPETVETIYSDSFGNMIVLFEADSVPGNIEITSGATVLTGVSRSQVNYYKAMVENATIFNMTSNGTVIFQEKNKVKFYNIAEENLTVYGTDSQNEYNYILTYSANDFVLNNSEATYVYNPTNGTLQKIEGLQTAFNEQFSLDFTNNYVYLKSADGIYKIDTTNLTYEKVFNYAVESQVWANGICVLNANNETYIFDSTTGVFTKVRDTAIPGDIQQHDFNGNMVGKTEIWTSENDNPVCTTTYYYIVLSDGTYVNIDNEAVDYVVDFTEAGYTNYALIETTSGVYIYNKTTGTMTKENDWIAIKSYQFEQYLGYTFEISSDNNTDTYIFAVDQEGYSFYKDSTVVAHDAEAGSGTDDQGD